MVEQEEPQKIYYCWGNHHQPDIYYLSQVHWKPTTTATIIRGFPKKINNKLISVLCYIFCVLCTL